MKYYIKLSLCFLLLLFYVSCNNKNSLDFVEKDYELSIKILDKCNQIDLTELKTSIASNSKRNKHINEDFSYFKERFDSIQIEIENFQKNTNKELTEKQFHSLHDSCVSLTGKIGEKLTGFTYFKSIADSMILDELFGEFESKSNWNAVLRTNKEQGQNLNLTLLKLQYDLKLIENKLINYYNTLVLSNVTSTCGLSPITAYVISQSKYIPAGYDYEADIVYADLSQHTYHKLIRIVVNGKEIPTEGNKGSYKVTAPGTPGFHKVEGFIEVGGVDGPEQLPFSREWFSFVPSADVSFGKYQEISRNKVNEFTVSSTDIWNEPLIVKSTKGILKKEKGIGNYSIVVDEEPNTFFKIIVSFKKPDGSVMILKERKMKVVQ